MGQMLVDQATGDWRMPAPRRIDSKLIKYTFPERRNRTERIRRFDRTPLGYGGRATGKETARPRGGRSIGTGHGHDVPRALVRR